MTNELSPQETAKITARELIPIAVTPSLQRIPTFTCWPVTIWPRTFVLYHFASQQSTLSLDFRLQGLGFDPSNGSGCLELVER